MINRYLYKVIYIFTIINITASEFIILIEREVIKHYNISRLIVSDQDTLFISE